MRPHQKGNCCSAARINDGSLLAVRSSGAHSSLGEQSCDDPHNGHI